MVPAMTDATDQPLVTADAADAAEAAQRRAAERVVEPALRVVIEDKAYSTLNWSLGGMLLDSYLGDDPVGARLTLLAGTEGSTLTARVTGRIVRVDRARRLAALAFDPVPPGSLAALDAFLKQATPGL